MSPKKRMLTIGCIMTIGVVNGCVNLVNPDSTCGRSETTQVSWDKASPDGRTPTQLLKAYERKYGSYATAVEPSAVSGNLDIMLEWGHDPIDYTVSFVHDSDDTCWNDKLSAPALLTLNGLYGRFNETIDAKITADVRESGSNSVKVFAQVPLDQWKGSWEPDPQLGNQVRISLSLSDSTPPKIKHGVIELINDSDNNSNEPTLIFNLGTTSQ